MGVIMQDQAIAQLHLDQFNYSGSASTVPAAMQDFVSPPHSSTSGRFRQDSSFESVTGSFHAHPYDSPHADDHDIGGGASEDEDPSYGERKRRDASHTSSMSARKSKAKNGAGSPGSRRGERKVQSGAQGNRLDEGEKKVRVSLPISPPIYTRAVR